MTFKMSRYILNTLLSHTLNTAKAVLLSSPALFNLSSGSMMNFSYLLFKFFKLNKNKLMNPTELIKYGAFNPIF